MAFEYKVKPPHAAHTRTRTRTYTRTRTGIHFIRLIQRIHLIHLKVEEDEPSDRIVSVFLCNYSLTFICECGECDGKSNWHDKYDKQTSERTNQRTKELKNERMHE